MPVAAAAAVMQQLCAQCKYLQLYFTFVRNEVPLLALSHCLQVLNVLLALLGSSLVSLCVTLHGCTAHMRVARRLLIKLCCLNTCAV
jgi:hypothetical protein